MHREDSGIQRLPSSKIFVSSNLPTQGDFHLTANIMSLWINFQKGQGFETLRRHGPKNRLYVFFAYLKETCPTNTFPFSPCSHCLLPGELYSFSLCSGDSCWRHRREESSFSFKIDGSRSRLSWLRGLSICRIAYRGWASESHREGKHNHRVQEREIVIRKVDKQSKIRKRSDTDKTTHDKISYPPVDFNYGCKWS